MKKDTIIKISIGGAIFVALLCLIIFKPEKQETQITSVPKLDIVNIFAFDYKFERDGELPEVPEPEQAHLSFKTADDGFDIYAPRGSGYRYGPSIIYYDDGSMDAYFASNGIGKRQWDFITYRHSDDGINWGQEKIVLQPTADSMDHYSVCDPGVIYFDGYYYLGYTSTTVALEGGLNNNVFVARSKNPDGPFEKWNGNGWGGDPWPIVYYNEDDKCWGAGEVCFCIADDKLFCYYTWMCPEGTLIKLSTADLVEDWPSTLEYKGVALDIDENIGDVVYVPDIHQFYIFTVNQRFTEKSCIGIYESKDGYKYHHLDQIREGISKYSHNMGISKKLDGSIDDDDNIIIGYAYARQSENSWGRWATRFQSLDIESYTGKTRDLSSGTHNVLRDSFSSDEGVYMMGIENNNLHVKLNMGTSFGLTNYWYDNLLRAHSLYGVSYEYDDDIIEIIDDRVYPVGEGECEVTMYYDEYYSKFKVTVRPEDYYYSDEIVSVEAVQDEIVLYLDDDGDEHHPQIRGLMKFADGSFGECYNDYTSDHPSYPAEIDGDEHHMEFDVDDESVVEVNDSGIILPNDIGETDVTVNVDDFEFKVHVVVNRKRLKSIEN